MKQVKILKWNMVGTVIDESETHVTVEYKDIHSVDTITISKDEVEEVKPSLKNHQRIFVNSKGETVLQERFTVSGKPRKDGKMVKTTILK